MDIQIGPKMLARAMLRDVVAMKHLIETNKAFNHVPYNTCMDMLADLNDLINALRFVLRHTGIPDDITGVDGAVEEAIKAAQGAIEDARALAVVDEPATVLSP